MNVRLLFMTLLAGGQAGGVPMITTQLHPAAVKASGCPIISTQLGDTILAVVVAKMVKGG